MDDKALRLLLIEDSEDDEFLLMRHLKKNDFSLSHRRVQTAQDLRAALEDEEWDIVISDYSMPKFTGMDALEIVLEYNSDLPFIMVSGAIGEERAAQVMKAGASDYVTKGNYARLIPAIERELRDYARRLEAKKSEAQIHKLSTALEQSANLVIIFNDEGRIEYINDAFSRLTGYQEDEVIGKTATFLRLEVSPADIYESMLQTVRSGEGWSGELVTRKKDGDPLPVQVTVSIIRGGGDLITNYLTIMEDITERKSLEAQVQRYTESLQEMVEERTRQLRAAIEQMEAILENSSDGIVLAMSSGDIVTANPAFHRIFDGNIKTSIEELIHVLPTESDIKSFAEALISVIYDRQAKRTGINFVTREGEQVDLDLALVPLQTENGQVDAVLISVRDITLVKDLERFKTEFIANAAHDLANPIAALKIRLYLLKSKPEQIDKHVEILDYQIKRMERLVDELRLLSEFDRGIIELDKEAVDLSEMVVAVLEAHEPIAGAKNISIHYETADDLPSAFIDPARFERVIVNLISNAINYTLDTGTVIVRTGYDGNALIFEVEDSGIGIEPDALHRIFDRFFRTDRAKDQDDRGTGLGLAIVKEIVEAHSGQISVHSTMDVGTTFTVLLPR